MRGALADRGLALRSPSVLSMRWAARSASSLREGGGSVFWFTVPAYVVKPALPGFEHSLADLTIAIVTRNAVLREGLTAQIRAAGGEVGRSGKEGKNHRRDAGGCGHQRARAAHRARSHNSGHRADDAADAAQIRKAEGGGFHRLSRQARAPCVVGGAAAQFLRHDFNRTAAGRSRLCGSRASLRQRRGWTARRD